MWRLLTFPLLTIAAINGHGAYEIHCDFQGYPNTDYMIHQAFAGGMVLALCCDYRIITSGKGFMCMNEVKFFSLDSYLSIV